MTEFATYKQISKLDELAMGKYGLNILQMMEIASHQFARIAKNYLKTLRGKRILVLSGTGHNGGDGLCAARYLANWGAKVTAMIAGNNLKTATKHQLGILTRMNLQTLKPSLTLPKADLVIDALLGYNQTGPVRAPYDQLITQANNQAAPIVSFDNPSGLNIESGNPTNFTITATVTVTLAAIKVGLTQKQAHKYVGKLFLVDLGIPKEAYDEVKLNYPFKNWI